MLEQIQHALTPPELWLYLGIPLMSALVGWGTNVLALKMTFYPLEFIGVPPWLGWQGIIPSKAAKMADMTVDMITTRLVGIEEVIERLEPDEVIAALTPGVERLIREIIDDVMREHAPELWGTLPEAVRQEIYKKAYEDAPVVIREALADVKIEIHELLDLKTMAVDAIMADKAFLNHIFLECGREEFKFIERSGVIFGALFGVLQMFLWIFYKGAWVLPTAGFLVGWATNILALKMIFAPLRPVRLGPFVWQGLFLKRQEEVSEAYARLIARNIVTVEKITQAIFNGPATDRLVAILQRHISEAVERYGNLTDPLVKLVLGSAQYDRIKQTIGARIAYDSPRGPALDIQSYAEEAMAIERTLRERLIALPPEQFEGLLRPVFQEDEWKLILVGAALGGLVGVAQLVFVFG